MTNRRSLVEGISPDQSVSVPVPDVEKKFVSAGKLPSVEEPETSTSSPIQATVLVPLSTRINPEISKALKRASLERRLEGKPCSTVQEIVDAALQSWLIHDTSDEINLGARSSADSSSLNQNPI